MTRRILVVGAGPTGVALVQRLARRHGDRDLEVIVADPGEPGPGTAFATGVPTHLVNVHAEHMSLDPDVPGEFDRWRVEHPERWRDEVADPAAGYEPFPPRAVFGRYVADRAHRLLHVEPVGFGRRHVAARVVALRPHGARWTAALDHAGTGASGPPVIEELDVDDVVLCLGHLPPDPGPLRRMGADPSAPLVDLEGVHELADRCPDARVAVVGTRLSGIDAVLALRARGHRGRVLLTSRSGLLPSVKGPLLPTELRAVPALLAATPPDGTLDLLTVARAVAADLERAEGRAIDWAAQLGRPATTAADLRAEIDAVGGRHPRPWQSVLTAMIPHVAGLWRRLDDDARQTFLDRYLTAWATRIAAFPAVTARRVLDELDAGSTAVLGGLRSVDLGRAGRVSICTTGGDVEVDAVINATGPGHGLHSLVARPVLRRLLADGLASPHPHGGLRVDPATFRVLDAAGCPLTGLHAVGDLTRGTFIATNAVGNTTRQVAELIDGMLAGADAAPSGAPGRMTRRMEPA